MVSVLAIVSCVLWCLCLCLRLSGAFAQALHSFASCTGFCGISANFYPHLHAWLLRELSPGVSPEGMPTPSRFVADSLHPPQA
jgi:hypothetical protein